MNYIQNWNLGYYFNGCGTYGWFNREKNNSLENEILITNLGETRIFFYSHLCWVISY